MTVLPLLAALAVAALQAYEVAPKSHGKVRFNVEGPLDDVPGETREVTGQLRIDPADWASGKDAMVLYGKNFAITAQPGVAPKLADIPADYESRLIKMDFNNSAVNRDRILAEWSKRYDAKSEKK